jgi:hypothetical protein
MQRAAEESLAGSISHIIGTMKGEISSSALNATTACHRPQYR